MKAKVCEREYVCSVSSLEPDHPAASYYREAYVPLETFSLNGSQMAQTDHHSHHPAPRICSSQPSHWARMDNAINMAMASANEHVPRLGQMVPSTHLVIHSVHTISAQGLNGLADEVRSPTVEHAEAQVLVELLRCCTGIHPPEGTETALGSVREIKESECRQAGPLSAGYPLLVVLAGM